MRSLLRYLQQIPLYARVLLSIFITIYLLIHFIFLRAPQEFPVDMIISIESGEGLNSITKNLSDRNVIRSEFFFKGLTILFGGSKGVQQGDYYFNREVSLLGVAYRLANGKFGLEPTPVLIPEGFTSFEIGERIKLALPDFDSKRFVSLTKSKEGYLFPDTYFFLPNVNPHTVIIEMQRNFDEKTAHLDVTEDIVIMASIIEREARQLETKKRISGILWNRIDIGMALQVDAVFGYIKGVTTFSPTLDDLEIDSPYNTYKYPGLPPGPISNPGLDSIIAALEPIESEYFFYLTDKEGVMHYSETFAEHVRNKRLYLR